MPIRSTPQIQVSAGVVDPYDGETRATIRLENPHGAPVVVDGDQAIDHFIDCLADGTAFETEGVDNLETLRLVEAAYAAAASQTTRG